VLRSRMRNSHVARLQLHRTHTEPVSVCGAFLMLSMPRAFQRLRALSEQEKHSGRSLQYQTFASSLLGRSSDRRPCNMYNTTEPARIFLSEYRSSTTLRRLLPNPYTLQSLYTLHADHVRRKSTPERS